MQFDFNLNWNPSFVFKVSLQSNETQDSYFTCKRLITSKAKSAQLKTVESAKFPGVDGTFLR